MKSKKSRAFAGIFLCLVLFAALSLQGCKGKEDKKETSGQEENQKDKDLEQDASEKEDGEEGAGEEASLPEEEAPAELPDTVRWFNASYAILTELNGWDYNIFAGLPANDMVKEMEIQSLEQWWSVTDRQSADETLDWALTEGHRTEFVENMQQLEQAGMGEVAPEGRKDFMLANFQVTEEEAQTYVNDYAMYEQYGAGAIDGWDYCRAMNLVSFYYLAQYYTEEEALDKSLEIAKTIQPLFTSWDELVDSYLRGYEYWADESSQERRSVYEDLKSREDNPYEVDYNTTLEKVW